MSSLDGDDRLTIPTSLPCPAWCTRPDGHGFISADSECVTCLHETTVAEIEVRVEGFSSHVTVAVISVESATDVDGPVTDLGVPNVYLDDHGDGDFTGPQARQIAAALLNAADVWDAAQAGG